MKDDTGYVVESDDEGYALKHDQVQGTLQRIGIKGIPVRFFNAVSDDSAEINEVISKQIESTRAVEVDRISGIHAAIDQLIENQQERHAVAAQQEVNRKLKAFIERHRKLPNRKRQAHDSLLYAVRTTHPSTIWATTRRGGSWGNLDVYYFLGTGTATDANLRSRPALHGLGELLRDILDDKELKPAHRFVQQLQSTIPDWNGNLAESTRQAGSLIFRPALEDDDELWDECEDIYGRGRPFRDEVAEKLRYWFEDPVREPLHKRLERAVQETWEQEVLTPLETICADNLDVGDALAVSE